MEREPKHIIANLTDLWCIQKGIKFNTFMLDPRNITQPMFPPSLRVYGNGERVSVHTAWKLREKVNRAILRLLDEKAEEIAIPLDYDECWYIDNIVSADTYQGSGQPDAFGQNGARKLLTQVFRVIYEHENGVTLKDSPAGDRKFSFEDLAAYIAQSGDSKGWRPPATGDAPDAGVR